MPTAQSMPANAGCKMNLGPGDAKVVRPTADDDPARKAIRLRRDIDRFNRHASCLYPRHGNTFAKLNAVMREYCCR